MGARECPCSNIHKGTQACASAAVQCAPRAKMAKVFSGARLYSPGSIRWTRADRHTHDMWEPEKVRATATVQQPGRGRQQRNRAVEMLECVTKFVRTAVTAGDGHDAAVMAKMLLMMGPGGRAGAMSDDQHSRAGRQVAKRGFDPRTFGL